MSNKLTDTEMSELRRLDAKYIASCLDKHRDKDGKVIFETGKYLEIPYPFDYIQHKN